jgi:FdhD protein
MTERVIVSCSLPASGILYTEHSSSRIVWQVPDEVPVAIQFNSEPYAVMMATPADFDDFAVGFALAEGLVRQASHVKAVLTLPEEDGYALDLAVETENLDPARLVKRSLEGRVGCGLCGIADIKDAIRMPRGRRLDGRLSPQAVLKAYAELPRYQPMNAVNRTVHAAAWCSVDGSILLTREDVGRHNALDKLIGALACGGADTAQGFVLMSSRCSFELVQKCAIAGIGALATISAPTALALRLANEAGLQLAALAHGDVMIFDRET